MTTAPPDGLLRDALDLLGDQGKRIEALEAMLFQIAPLTVHVDDLPQVSPDSVAASSDETKLKVLASGGCEPPG
jgi:hypothetical protein